MEIHDTNVAGPAQLILLGKESLFAKYLDDAFCRIGIVTVDGELHCQTAWPDSMIIAASMPWQRALYHGGGILTGVNACDVAGFSAATAVLG